MSGDMNDHCLYVKICQNHQQGSGGYLFEMEKPSQRNGFEDTLKKTTVTKFVLRACSKLRDSGKA
jgi:hypothetical protein